MFRCYCLCHISLTDIASIASYFWELLDASCKSKNPPQCMQHQDGLFTRGKIWSPWILHKFKKDESTIIIFFHMSKYFFKKNHLTIFLSARIGHLSRRTIPYMVTPWKSKNPHYRPHNKPSVPGRSNKKLSKRINFVTSRKWYFANLNVVPEVF